MTPGEHARPFLTFHVGQAGVQIGHAIWELLCLEHNILPSGGAKPECSGNGFYDAMFIKSASGHFMPRSVFVDTDPTCIDEVRTGPYRELFSSTQLLSDHSDAGCNYMRGRHDFNHRLVPDTVDRFRWLMEKTDTTPTAFLIHGVSGGTGSGVAVSCLESLTDQFGSALRVIELNVTSGRSGLQNSCELVNQVMYQFESRDFTNLTFSLTNSAMFNVCRTGLSLTNATYTHVNRMLAMCFSNLTAMERFPGTINCSVDCISNNVLPFKHLKHPILACAPFSGADTMNKERISALAVASAVVEQDSQLADVDLRQGRHMAGVFIFRGAAKPSDIEQAMASLRPKNRLEFVDWAPGGFKTGLIELPPYAVTSSGIASSALSVTMVSNHTAVATLFRGQSESIRKLSGGSYFMHSYDASTSGGITAGHNSSTGNLLKEACDHMDTVATFYETDKPPVEHEADASAPKRGTQHTPRLSGGPDVRQSDRVRQSESAPSVVQLPPYMLEHADAESPKRAMGGESAPPAAGSPMKTMDAEPTPLAADSPRKTMGAEQTPLTAGSPSKTIGAEPTQLVAYGPRKTIGAEPTHPAADGTHQPAPVTTVGGSEKPNWPVTNTGLQKKQPDGESVASDRLARRSNQQPSTAKDSSRATMGQGGHAPSSQSTPGADPGQGELAARASRGPVPAAAKKPQSTGGCCKKRQPPVKAAPLRAQSQNHAATAVQTDTESPRSSNCSDLAARRYRSSSSDAIGLMNRHNHREELTASTRSIDSSQELCDIIQSCLPDPALVDTTISSVRLIIEKYNRLFGKGSPF